MLSEGEGTRKLLKALLPEALRRLLRRRYTGAQQYLVRANDPVTSPADLRRLTPVGASFQHRGQPIDRYYVEKFLDANSSYIRGRVLEVEEDTYTKRFGADHVTSSDVLHVDPKYPRATIVSDLCVGENLDSDSFDCVVLTQTLQHIYDVRSAIKTLYRILRNGSCLLATVPGISQSIPTEPLWGDYWRFTSASMRLLLQEAFGPSNVYVTSYGNVLTSTGFLHNLACEDLTASELEYLDPRYELIICVRAVKPFQS